MNALPSMRVFITPESPPHYYESFTKNGYGRHDMQCRVAFNMYPLTYRKTVETVYESFPQLYAVLSFALVVETVDPEKHQKETQVYFSHNLSIKLGIFPPNHLLIFSGELIKRG